MPYPEEKRSLSEFCLKACKSTKSNSVILAHEYEPGFFMVLAMGAGQPNRVDSIRKLAATKAVENLRIIYERENPETSFEDYCQRVMSECVMASDAFFPFDDSIIHGQYSFSRATDGACCGKYNCGKPFDPGSCKQRYNHPKRRKRRKNSFICRILQNWSFNYNFGCYYLLNLPLTFKTHKFLRINVRGVISP